MQNQTQTMKEFHPSLPIGTSNKYVGQYGWHYETLLILNCQKETKHDFSDFENDLLSLLLDSSYNESIYTRSLALLHYFRCKRKVLKMSLEPIS